jgi:hypothetical protein
MGGTFGLDVEALPLPWRRRHTTNPGVQLSEHIYNYQNCSARGTRLLRLEGTSAVFVRSSSGLTRIREITSATRM